MDSIACFIHFFVALLLPVFISSQTNAAGEPSQKPNEEFRLPDTVVPVQQWLEIYTNLVEDNFCFGGSTTIKIMVTKETNQVILHSKELTIAEKDVSVTCGEGDRAQTLTTSIEYQTDYDFLIINVEETLVVGIEYLLYIPFNSILNEASHGYVRMSYNDESDNKVWFAITSFGNGRSRSAFPSWDEPRFKVVFSILLSHHESFRAISNMNIIDTDTVEGKDGWVIDEFDDTPKMSSYLVVIMLSQFEFRQVPNIEPTINIWSRSNSTLDQLNMLEEIVQKVFPYYNEKFDFKYPLPKLDIVAIPDFVCDQSGFGVVLLKESCIFYDSGYSDPVFSPGRIVAEISEGLASQWFGDIVSVIWWSDVLIANGLAFFYQEYGQTGYYGLEKYQEIRLDSWNYEERSSDSYVEYGKALVKPIIDAEDLVQNLTNGVFSSKSLLFFRMLCMIISNETFFTGVTSYLQKYQYSVASVENFLNELNIAGQESETITKEFDLNIAMKEYLTLEGFPLITVETDYSQQKAYVNQTRFLLQTILTDEERAEVERETFTIPLSWVTSNNLDFDNYMVQDWLPSDCSSKTITLKNFTEDDFILFNVQVYGLYAVNYSKSNWDRIANRLLDKNEFTSIHVLNRMQILFDSLQLAWSGIISYAIPFKILQYLSYETEEHPIEAAFFCLSDIYFYLLRTELHEKLNKFVCLFLAPLFYKYGSITFVPDDNLEASVKIVVDHWACIYEVEGAREQCTDALMDWYETPDPDSNNKLNPAVRDTFYCFGIKNGNVDLWHFMFERFRAAKSEVEKVTILEGLACTDDESVLSEYLLMSLDSSQIDSKYFWTVFNAISCKRAPLSIYLVSNFLEENFHRILEIFGNDVNRVCSLLDLVGTYVDSKDDLGQFQASLNDNLKENCQSNIDDIIQGTQDSINWYNIHYLELSNLLDQYVGN